MSFLLSLCFGSGRQHRWPSPKCRASLHSAATATGARDMAVTPSDDERPAVMR